MQPLTYLVTIRMWQEEIENGVYEWRGSMRSNKDGEVKHFAGLPALADITLADLVKQIVENQEDEE